MKGKSLFCLRDNGTMQFPTAFTYPLSPLRIESRQPCFKGGYRDDIQRSFSQKSKLPFAINKNDHNTNRYDRFRQRLLMSVPKETLEQSSAIKNFNRNENLMDVGKLTMEILSSNRRSFNRTWKRMRPLVELVVNSCNNTHETKENDLLQTRAISIADVGCDHGILSLSLACIAWVASKKKNNNQHNEQENHQFISKVIGADVSAKALENGGFVSLKKINDVLARMDDDDLLGMLENIEAYSSDSLKHIFSDSIDENRPITHSNLLPVEFRIGDGLEPLRTGEADGIILAGMGVHTMLDILFGMDHGFSARPDAKWPNKLVESDSQSTLDSGSTYPVSDSSYSDSPPLDRLQTRYLFLQPTNSRPRHLLLMYDQLYTQGGFELIDEKIVFVGGRWYISSFFERPNDENLSISKGAEIDDNSTPEFLFPGHFLKDKVSDENIYDEYVRHHAQWLNNDYVRRNGILEKDDVRWIQYLISEENDNKWTDIVSWFEKN